MVAAWLAGGGPRPARAKERADLAPRPGRRVKAAAYFCQAASRNITPLAFAQGVAGQLESTITGFGGAVASTLANYLKIEGKVIAKNVTGGISAGVAIHHLNLAGLGDELSFDRGFSEPLKRLYANGYSEPILLLVDALDEAQSYTGVTIAKLLSSLNDLPASIRILITTRDDPRVLKLYRNAPCLDLIDDAPEDMEDLRNHVLRRLAGLPLEQTERAEFATRLVDTADGIFLYATIVLDELLGLPREKLPDLRLYPFPAGLSGLYREFINRELGNNEALWFNTYEPLLGLIAVAQGDGLTAGQLAPIVGQDVGAGLRATKQYLSGDLPDGPFRLYHQSFVDFLLEDKGNWDFHIAAERMHRRIADHYRSSHIEASPSVIGSTFPVDLYYFRYYPYHLAAAGEHDTLRNLLLDYRWVSEKLKRTDLHSLYSDYRLANGDPALSLVQKVLGLSGPTLTVDHRQLAGQLLGRLSPNDAVGIRALLTAAHDQAERPSLLPISPTLSRPGEQLRRIDHAGTTKGLAILPDRGRAVSSDGACLQLWDLERRS